MKPAASKSEGWASAKPPLLRFLDRCHADFSSETGGDVADYIPELGKADPDHFGISLATLDGHVYEVGDTTIPFTIQSMSKPFVFALALDTLGAAHVERAIGVEPAGDPFNSIRLNSETHPFNPMVNAGAITCSGLLYETKGRDAFDYIRQALGRFAGRELGVDEAVYASESATGDRNRAIGYLLRTNAVIKDNVAAVLHVYFKQCAILVTARDSAIIADYPIDRTPSRRSGRPHAQKILDTHHRDVRVIELVGTLSFSNVDYASRRLAATPRPQFVIFALRRVAAVTHAGARLLAE